jgi:anti-sigma factor ChrR (cupin superfamily)
MTQKQFEHSEETKAWAALFALGSLSGEERVQFERHLQHGCPVCEQEIQSLDEVVRDLALSTPSATPPNRVRERLLKSLAGSKPKVSSHSQPSVVSQGVLLQQPGLLISRSSDVSWDNVAPGIERKLLFVDPKRRYNTSLLRVQAGTRYPSHRHADVEEILVLEGDLHIHGVVMGAGDYCRAEPDSIHQETFTEGGCLLLQLTSQLDQVTA